MSGERSVVGWMGSQVMTPLADAPATSRHHARSRQPAADLTAIPLRFALPPAHWAGKLALDALELIECVIGHGATRLLRETLQHPW